MATDHFFLARLNDAGILSASAAGHYPAETCNRSTSEQTTSQHAAHPWQNKNSAGVSAKAADIILVSAYATRRAADFINARSQTIVKRRKRRRQDKKGKPLAVRRL